MRKLEFYTTIACHLCELAEVMLRQQKPLEVMEIVLIDISESDQLIQEYGERIPVLKFADSDIELAWPFSHAELQNFLQDAF
jgi:hypothetical protein